MAPFTAAAIQAAFVNIAEDLGVSVQRASYLTSLSIAIIGVAPLFWRPLSHTYGRRPVFLWSLLCSLVGNVGCAVSPSYATMALCRAITTFFISTASSIGSAVVIESYFSHERAWFMGVWTVMVTLGVPVAPLVFGFVAFRVGYRWIYWILAIVRSKPHPNPLSTTDPFYRQTAFNSSCTSSSAPKPATSPAQNHSKHTPKPVAFSASTASTQRL